MRGSLRLPVAARAVPLLMFAAIPACGDDGMTSATTLPSTTGPTNPTNTPSTTQGEPTTADSLDTGVTGGSGGQTMGTTDAPTTAGPNSTGPGDTTSVTTATTGGSTGPGTTDGTTTQPAGTSTTSPGESSSDGGEESTGPFVCPPDNSPSTFDFIWIANSSQGTVSKINTMTGVEVGRYLTAPQPSQPSRTSVNQYGDVAVSNRDPGGITKISALVEKCIDKNNNGMIETSNGPNNILPWGSDECVLWHQTFPSPGYSYGPRPTAWEGALQDPVTCETPVPRLWGGWMDNGNTAHFIRLEGDTGMTLDEVLHPGWFGSGYGPYGGAVNGEGDLYAIGLDTMVIHLDSETLQLTLIPPPPDLQSYGLAVDKNGNLWVGSYGVNSMYHYNVQQQQWYPLGPGGGWVLGLQVDKMGRVWGAGTGSCRLVHADVNSVQYVNANIPLPGCSQPWGASIDNEGYVWIVDKANKAFKVNPDTYAVELVVQGLVDPYTYSDMTGQGLKLVLPQ